MGAVGLPALYLGREILEFGRFAASNRKDRGEGKPETFDFLGFTYYWGTTRIGKPIVKMKTARKKLIAKKKG